MTRAIATSLVLMLCAAVTGCGGREPRAEQGTREGILQVGNGAEPEELDPHIVTGVPEHRILSALFEGLVNADPATLKPVPGTAEKWAVSEDGTVYTFTIRENARWSNGDPVTAEDFVYAWERILTPAMASKYASMLHCMKNARAFNEGTITDFAEVGAKALDTRTVQVTLEHPTAYFLALHIHYAWYPVHKATIEGLGGMTARGTKWTQPENMVCNGPFTLERWEPDSVLSVAKSETYWDAANVRLNGIAFYPIDNALAEDRTFRVGDLHLTENLPLSKVEVYQKEGWDALHIDPYAGVYYYRLNVTRPPFDDPRVRRAFAMSIDREALVKNVVKAGRIPAGSYVPPDTGGFTSTASVPYDVAAAQALLAEAGYPGGEGLPEVELLYNTSENHKQIAEAVQQMWKKALGARVSLLNQDWKVYLSSMDALDYGIARAAWIGDYDDAYNFLECFLTGNGNNRTGYASKEYDDLVFRAARALDPAERMGLLQQAEARLLEDAPIIPVYFYTRPYLKSPDLKGYTANKLGYIGWKYLYLEAAAGGE